MLDGFARERVGTGEVEIDLVRGGSGPPVLLLHGYPQTRAMWHLVAPRLAERFTIVAPDLRGYGDSSKPPGGPEHAEYSKRAMANDQVAVMTELGFDRFAVVGHDRGARVAHRLALDHPERVTRLAALDIVPTHAVFRSTNKELALSTYHWFFLSQPYDLPERLIGGDPSFFLRWHLCSWSGGRDEFFSAGALAEYERCFADPACIHATCEDYRAGASIDLEHDEADLDRKLDCPLLVLWGEGRLDRNHDVLALWRERAADVRGRSLPCGHFLAEELPEETASELVAFLEAP
jgi:haloacetate dehalogenase